ncbi:MAG: glycosyltransferase family 2 protein [Gemmataceae bacterium]
MEILVIDDGSLNSSASRVAKEFPGVIIHRFHQSRGFCVAANYGIRAASAPIVQLLNDDAEVTAGWAAPALAAFADPHVAAVAPLVLRWSGDVIDSAGDTYDAGGFAQPRGRGQHESAFQQPGSVAGASACGAFYRRDAVLEVGGFPESFGSHFEDVDLSCRLRRAGYRIEFVPTSRVLHRGSSTYGPPRGRLLERQSCNEERLFWRNQSGRPSELLRHGAVVLAKALRRWQEGRLTPWLCGRLRAWAMMPGDLVRSQAVPGNEDE